MIYKVNINIFTDKYFCPINLKDFIWKKLKYNYIKIFTFWFLKSWFLDSLEGNTDSITENEYFKRKNK